MENKQNAAGPGFLGIPTTSGIVHMYAKFSDRSVTRPNFKWALQRIPREQKL